MEKLIQLLPPNEGKFHVIRLTEEEKAEYEKIDWVGSIPIILMHLVAFAALCLSQWDWSPVKVRWSTTNIVFCAILYYARMFCITGFMHRYFSHKTFKTSRVFQFGM